MSNDKTVCTRTPCCSCGSAPKSDSRVPRWKSSARWRIGKPAHVRAGHTEHPNIPDESLTANRPQARLALPSSKHPQPSHFTWKDHDDTLHEVLLGNVITAAHNLL